MMVSEMICLVGLANQNVVAVVECLHMDKKCSTIKEVIDSQRCPNKFRIRCRIADYYPMKVEDFVRAECREHGM